MTDTYRVEFRCNGDLVTVDAEPGESLLSVLRERLGLRSAKDGCAPQGQCGCFTVLVDGAARVACVTPATRVGGRDVTTIEGLDPQHRDELASAFLATGATQCGFCTPGILMRASALLDRGDVDPVEGRRGSHQNARGAESALRRAGREEGRGELVSAFLATGASQCGFCTPGILT